MTIRIMTGLLAAALAAAAIQTPAAAQTEQPSTAGQQCRWEAPTQSGPRAPLRPATWVCPESKPSKQVCGRYERHWPHWLSQRALPPVRRWVTERC